MIMKPSLPQEFTRLPWDCFSCLPAVANQHFQEATLLAGGTTFQRNDLDGPAWVARHRTAFQSVSCCSLPLLVSLFWVHVTMGHTGVLTFPQAQSASWC